MALLTPPPTTAKFFPKLHYNHRLTCAPSNIFIEQRSLPPPITTITATNSRRKSHAFKIRNAATESELKLESESKFKSSELKSPELKPEFKSTELKSPELKPEFKSSELKSPELKPEFKSSELKSPELKPEFKSSELKSPELKPEFKSSELKSPELKPEFKSSELKSPELKPDFKSSELESPESKLESGGGRRIPSADDMITRLREMYRGRNGNKVDKVTLGLLVTIHSLALFAPFTFTWGALWLSMGLYTITYLGITLSYHRNLSHKTFKIPKWLEYTFAYCGAQALQGSPIDWVSTHRYHHQFCDSERDPHTPIKGFWHSYIKWMLDTDNIGKMTELPNNVKDLEKQPFYRFLRNTYFLHPVGLGFVLYALGGFPFVVWGIGVRTLCSYHMTWLVNSICHGRGVRVWDTDDISVNIWWLGILAFGAGWHNNHHAFEYSARHGLEWWQIDFTWYVIRLLEITGLATDVKLPTPMDMQRKALPSKTY